MGMRTALSSFFFPVPWGMGYGYGYPMGGGGGSFMSLLFWGTFAVILLQVVQSVMRGQIGDGADAGGGGTYYGDRVTVAKVQVRAERRGCERSPA